MVTLQKKIVDQFLASLVGDDAVRPEQVEQLRVLLENDKKPKADDFVKLFSAPIGGEIK